MKIWNNWFRQPNKRFPFPSLLHVFFFPEETDYLIGVRKKNVFGRKRKMSKLRRRLWRKGVAADRTESHARKICGSCILSI